MKLSDFKGDEALDVMADIIEPATNIINDKKTKELRSDRSKLIQHILKKHKKDVLRVYEILYQDKGANATPISLVNMLLDILSDKELMSLFTMQGQNEEEERSGSATENTEDGGR